MAEFITKCPHCNVELQAQNEWIGMEAECPECGKSITIKKMINPENDSEETDIIKHLQYALIAIESRFGTENQPLKRDGTFWVTL